MKRMNKKEFMTTPHKLIYQHAEFNRKGYSAISKIGELCARGSVSFWDKEDEGGWSNRKEGDWIDFNTTSLTDAIVLEDWETDGCWWDGQEAIANQGADLNLEPECWGRDGCFDDDESYLVWSKKDIGKLIGVLTKIHDQYPDGTDPKNKNLKDIVEEKRSKI